MKADWVVLKNLATLAPHACSVGRDGRPRETQLPWGQVPQQLLYN